MNVQNIPHPSFFIDTLITERIRDFAAGAEQLQQLHPQQVAIIYKEKWFNLFVPAAYGGLQMSLPQGIQTEESLAWADGSTAWTVTLCSGANWFIGFLQPSLSDEIFNTVNTCLAGSGKATGVAKDLGDAYEVSGYWNYASGAFIATAFTANCIIEKDGVALLNADGTALVKSFVFLRNEVILHPTWKSIGMIATASNSFEVKQLRVPKNRSFTIDSNAAILDAPVYRYPFQQLAEATLAVNSSGMAIRFLDLCDTFSEETKPGSLTQLQLTAAKNKLQMARNYFYNAVQQSWQAHVQQQPFAACALKAVTLASRELAATARKLVDEIYPYCGLAAANPAIEINRVWRNLHTASQHALLLSDK